MAAVRRRMVETYGQAERVCRDPRSWPHATGASVRARALSLARSRCHGWASASSKIGNVYHAGVDGFFAVRNVQGESNYNEGQEAAKIKGGVVIRSRVGLRKGRAEAHRWSGLRMRGGMQNAAAKRRVSGCSAGSERDGRTVDVAGRNRDHSYTPVGLSRIHPNRLVGKLTPSTDQLPRVARQCHKRLTM